jgi:hypothetical protein
MDRLDPPRVGEVIMVMLPLSLGAPALATAAAGSDAPKLKPQQEAPSTRVRRLTSLHRKRSEATAR